MGVDAVRAYFKRLGREEEILEFNVSSATVELAAQALGCPPERIAKTLSFYHGDGCVLIVAAGDARIDNAKFKRQFGQKAKMLAAEDVERLTGHPIGGVCPFAVREGVSVYTDRSLQRFSTVFPACGSPSSAIELSCDELYGLSGSLDWIDVCKGWQEENGPSGLV